MKTSIAHCHALSLSIIWTRFYGASRLEINSDQLTYPTELDEWSMLLKYGGYWFLLICEGDYLSVTPADGSEDSVNIIREL